MRHRQRISPWEKKIEPIRSTSVCFCTVRSSLGAVLELNNRVRHHSATRVRHDAHQCSGRCGLRDQFVMQTGKNQQNREESNREHGTHLCMPTGPDSQTAEKYRNVTLFGNSRTEAPSRHLPMRPQKFSAAMG